MIGISALSRHSFIAAGTWVRANSYTFRPCILGIFGGYTACVYGGFSSSAEFIEGIQLDFIPFHVTYSFAKTFLFALLLATIPSYHGFYLRGGALDVGKASTTSFVWTSVAIIIVNYIVTQILLT